MIQGQSYKFNVSLVDDDRYSENKLIFLNT